MLELSAHLGEGQRLHHWLDPMQGCKVQHGIHVSAAAHNGARDLLLPKHLHRSSHRTEQAQLKYGTYKVTIIVQDKYS